MDILSAAIGRMLKLFMGVVFTVAAAFGFLLVCWAAVFLVIMFFQPVLVALRIPFEIPPPTIAVDWLAAVINGVIRVTPAVLMLGFAEASISIAYILAFIAAGLSILAMIIALVGAVLLQTNPELANGLLGFSSTISNSSTEMLLRTGQFAGSLAQMANDWATARLTEGTIVQPGVSDQD